MPSRSCGCSLIELHAQGVDEVEREIHDGRTAADGALARLTLTAVPCTPDGLQVDVTIEDAATNKTVRRAMSLSDLPRESRPRALALGVAELVRATWAELALSNAVTPSTPVPDPVRRAVVATLRLTPASPVSPPAAAPTEPLVTLAAAVAARMYPTYSTALVGPQIAFAVGPSSRLPLRLQLDSSFFAATVHDPLGTIALRAWTAGASLMVARTGETIGVGVGPRVGIGWAWASGQAAAPGTTAHSAGGTVADLAMTAELCVALGAGFWASAGLEVGGALRPLVAQANGRDVGGIGGVFTGVALGLARSF